MKVNIDNAISSPNLILENKELFSKIKNDLHNKKGEGSEFTGWLNLPSSVKQTEIDEIKLVAKKFEKAVDYAVVIGIGGSYLGAKAVISALEPEFTNTKSPKILFAGINLDQDYLHNLLQFLDDNNYGIIVISKSGTTIEPAIAFRLLEKHLINKIGETKAKDNIIAITDKNKGALLKLSKQKGYKTFVISDDIGGRFSVLTPVGLLPIAIAGFDIEKLIKGALKIEKETSINSENDIAMNYAIARNLQYKGGNKIELMTSFHSKLNYFGEWWKQLYGESEGKNHKGLLPVFASLTTDLHSLGQYMQDGERILFETVISVDEKNNKLLVPETKENLDNLNYLSGKEINFINKKAEKGTIKAHLNGGVPVINITIEKIDEYNLGQMIYFFEKACAYSAYSIGVNPFDQPGVEEYKKNMMGLLNKN
jgi:glucose-6-phosphate isomerase